MALSFPNSSRSYDVTNRGVWFWGYDRTIKIAFYIDAGALSKIGSQTMVQEAKILSDFDASLERIREVAGDIYSRRRKAALAFSFALTDADF